MDQSTTALEDANRRQAKLAAQMEAYQQARFNRLTDLVALQFRAATALFAEERRLQRHIDGMLSEPNRLSKPMERLWEQLERVYLTGAEGASAWLAERYSIQRLYPGNSEWGPKYRPVVQKAVREWNGPNAGDAKAWKALCWPLLFIIVKEAFELDLDQTPASVRPRTRDRFAREETLGFSLGLKCLDRHIMNQLRTEVERELFDKPLSSKRRPIGLEDAFPNGEPVLLKNPKTGLWTQGSQADAENCEEQEIDKIEVDELRRRGVQVLGEEKFLLLGRYRTEDKLGLAAELGIKQGTLRQWVFRWEKKLRRAGVWARRK